MPGPGPDQDRHHDHSGDHRRLPADSDLEIVDTRRGPRPPIHRRPGYLGLVGIGGAAGVAARFLITDAAAPRLSQPVVTLMINIAGCLLLGVLLEALARAGDDHGIRRNLRLLLGTGVLGGFTTYSTFAVDTATLVGPHPGLAVLYGLGSILLGCLAAAAGVWIAGGAHRHRARGGRR